MPQNALNLDLFEECDDQRFVPSNSGVTLSVGEGLRAIEDDDFPFEAFSDIAQAESWRKEINRPIYHVHKWWAQRLGSVFRAIVLGCFAPTSSNLLELYYSKVSIPDQDVFDPFMGSGTTLGETLKLGANAIGRDINPVAHFLVKNALAVHSRTDVLSVFKQIERDTADRIRQFYKTTLPDGSQVDVLYYFWVKCVDCPECSNPVELFSSRVFAQHAYRKKYPKAQTVCQHCGEVNEVRYDDTETTCLGCKLEFNPQVGPAKGQSATCPCCEHKFPIAKTIRNSDHAPNHKLYAKLVLKSDGTKGYYAATDEDRVLYARAEQELSKTENAYPVVRIKPGYNTNQALGYNYRHWHEMFNARQLLCLSILGTRISQINDSMIRDLFMCLFSGALEFNNIFASYKGEGTGAVRHMFAHHVLKPERVPLEANLWGTKKSSGSFSTMFEGRIRRALDYAENPFEQRILPNKKTEKVFGLSEKMGYEIAQDYHSFQNGMRVYLSCGDSSQTDIPSKSVDAIITDPPFFDNVHYSELADFFHVWQNHFLSDRKECTTRAEGEVQNPDVGCFTERLGTVWQEANRVLKDEGILAFTYHHSRSEGWSSVLTALLHGGFRISAVQPIKAEMSVAMPKLQAKEPIDLDIIIVCRKRDQVPSHDYNGDIWRVVLPKSNEQVRRFCLAQRKLSRNDVRVILMAQLIRFASTASDETRALQLVHETEDKVEEQIDRLHSMACSILEENTNGES